MFQELELVQDHNFFFPCQTCPFRWSHLARMKHNHLCLQTGVAVAARESVSQAATPAIRAICAALSAPMFPLAPLKVADTTGGLDDISREFYCVKIRFRPTNGQYKRLDDTFVDDITGFYCIKKGRGMQDRSEPLKWERYLPVRGRRATWCHSRAQTRSAAQRKSASEPPSLTFRSAAVW